MTESSPSLSVGLAIATASLLVSATLAEMVVRVVDGGWLSQLNLFEEDRGVGVRLQPDAVGHVALAGRHPTTVATGALGQREPVPPHPRWIVVGDSQVLGLGVAGEQTFTARLQEHHQPAVNLGVPGHSVADAVRQAEHAAPALEVRRILIVVNQANDWDEQGSLVEERYVVAGGWLLDRARTSGWQETFFSTPLSRSHLLHHGVVLVSRSLSPAEQMRPLWSRDPEAAMAVTRLMAAEILGLAERHPGWQIATAYLPLDITVSSERLDRSPYGPLLAQDRPWDKPGLGGVLHAALGGAPFLDLSSELRDHPDAFLDGDYHLSPEGHGRVADALGVWLTDTQESP